MAERETVIKDGKATVYGKTPYGMRTEFHAMWRLDEAQAAFYACGNCWANGTGDSAGRPIICLNPQEYDQVLLCLPCLRALADEIESLVQQGTI